MQEFEDLKTDINNLISTAAQTVNALVSAAQAKLVPVGTATPSDVATYASQMTQLSSQIRSAMSVLQTSAATVLGMAPTPAAAPSTPVPTSPVVSPTPTPAPAPAPAPGAPVMTVGPDSFKAAN